MTKALFVGMALSLTFVGQALATPVTPFESAWHAEKGPVTSVPEVMNMSVGVGTLGDAIGHHRGDARILAQLSVQEDDLSDMTIGPVSISEPTAMVLLGLGLLGLVIRLRRRRS